MPEPNEQRGLPHADTTEFIQNLHSGTLSADSRRHRTQTRRAGEPIRMEEGVAPLQQMQMAEDDSSTAEPPTRTLACMVTHGMGQQVRFQTCAQIAEAFVRGGRKPSSVRADRVQLVPNGELLGCMKLTFDATPDKPQTELHIFEGYWAPLTEGKITFTATILALFGAAWSGIKSCLKKSPSYNDPSGQRGVFTRWVFQHLYQFPIKKRTFSHLIWITLVLLFTVLLAYLCEQVLAHAWLALKPLLHAQKLGSGGLWSYLSVYWCQFLCLLHRFAEHWVRNLVRIAVLAIAYAYAYWFRYFVVEYVGDVIIYVSSFKVSLYQQVRDAIQKTVVDVGQQIVAATVPPTSPDTPPAPNVRPLYDGIIFVGHSLGSVITYDLINALVVWDATACNGRYQVDQRIRKFITFGSPLDKTAFLFRTQMREDHDYREALAGLMQPLILDYTFRQFPWVNLHSRMDPVSGSLAYYDLPPQDRPKTSPPLSYVSNIIDPAARIPLVAHTQYWNGALLTAELLAGL